jgi:hypothetical protein
MGDYPVTRDRERQLAELRERWPDMAVSAHWWGFLAVPRGTEPVVLAMHAESVDNQLERWQESTGAIPGTSLASPPEDIHGIADKVTYLPIDGPG